MKSNNIIKLEKKLEEKCLLGYWEKQGSNGIIGFEEDNYLMVIFKELNSDEVICYEYPSVNSIANDEATLSKIMTFIWNYASYDSFMRLKDWVKNSSTTITQRDFQVFVKGVFACIKDASDCFGIDDYVPDERKGLQIDWSVIENTDIDLKSIVDDFIEMNHLSEEAAKDLLSILRITELSAKKNNSLAR